jgi:hypothetical protein
MGSDDCVERTESLGSWTTSIVRNSKQLESGQIQGFENSSLQGTNTVRVYIPSIEFWGRPSFRIFVLSSCLRLWVLGKVHKSSDFEFKPCFKYA